MNEYQHSDDDSQDGIDYQDSFTDDELYRSPYEYEYGVFDPSHETDTEATRPPVETGAAVLVYPYDPVTETLVVTNAGIVYPWYPLHNDAPALVRIAGIDWPSASHFIYASVLGTGLDRVAVRQTPDIGDMKTRARELYTQYLDHLQRDALARAYDAAYTQDPQFRAEVHAIRWRARVVVYDSPHPVLGKAGENLIGTLLMNIQVPARPGRRIATYVLSEDGVAGPYAPRTHGTGGLRIGAWQFPTIMHYVYFRYFLFFVENEEIAHMHVQSSANLEDTFLALQSTFFQTKVWNAVRESLVSKFREMSPVLLAVAPPHLEMVDEDPFLGRAYVSNASTVRLRGLKASMAYPPQATLDHTVYERFEDDEWIRSWVLDVRLPLLLDTVSLLAEYLGIPTLGGDTESLQWILAHAFPSCRVPDKAVVADQAPAAFRARIPETYEPRAVYTLWTSISDLFAYIPSSRSVRGPQEYMRTVYDTVPLRPSLQQVTHALLHVLFMIRSLTVRFSRDLKPSLPGPRQLVLAQHLLRVPSNLILSSPPRSVNGSAVHVGELIAAMYRNERKLAGMKAGSLLVAVAEYLSAVDALPLAARAAIFSYT